MVSVFFFRGGGGGVGGRPPPHEKKPALAMVGSYFWPFCFTVLVNLIPPPPRNYLDLNVCKLFFMSP